MKIYKYPQEIWDEKKCSSVSRKQGTDGYGSRHPYKGLVQPTGVVGPYYGQQIYNGGTIIDGEWFNGYERPEPIVHENYELYSISSWGRYIRKKS